MGFWDIFSPQIPPTTGGSWRSRSFLDALLDDKKEQSRSSRTSQSSYIYDYDDDDDDYDWEKEERKRVRKSLKLKSKQFLREKSVQIVERLSSANLCHKKSYEPTLKLKRLKSDYLNIDFDRCFHGTSVGDFFNRNATFGGVFEAIKTPANKSTQSTSDTQVIETISKDGYMKLSNIELWFELTYNDKLNLHSQFQSDLSMLAKINDARHSIQKLLDEGL